MAVSLDARIQRSRRLLRETLLDLLEEKPFEQITVREITSRARVGYATFFRHYAAKESLLHDLAAGRISDLLDITVPILFMAGSREACQTLCTSIHDDRPLWTALLVGGAAGTVREEFVRQARLIGVSFGDGTGWLPQDLRIVWATSGAVDILAWWLPQTDSYSIDQIAEIVDRLVVSPVVAGGTAETQPRTVEPALMHG